MSMAITVNTNCRGSASFFVSIVAVLLLVQPEKQLNHRAFDDLVVCRIAQVMVIQGPKLVAIALLIKEDFSHASQLVLVIARLPVVELGTGDTRTSHICRPEDAQSVIEDLCA